MPHGPFQDVLNPSVVKNAGGYLNLYSAFDGHIWHTAVAESADGIEWTDRGVILSPDPKTWEGSYIAANGSALSDNGRILYWYQAGPRGTPRIGLASGPPWIKDPKPVLEPGPYGSFDEFGVADPYVIRIGGTFYMYYLGQDRARPTRQRIGLARSTDGRRWEKLRTNPILEFGTPGAFDDSALGEPAVFSARGFYWMLYTATDASRIRRLGLARSIDGVHWDKQPSVFTGAETWNSKALCDASVIVEGETIHVWFGGGDIASPDEGLHGQIGYASLVTK
jgi:predicted GH43/DUF377 family glycosyl hydrolase